MEMTSPLGTCYQQLIQQPLLKEGGVVERTTLNVGCTSDDADSVRSDTTEEYVVLPVNGSTIRRKRKMLQPRRAPMYGSGVEGGDSIVDTKDHSRPGPQQKRHQKQAVNNNQNTIANLLVPSAPQPVPGAFKTHKTTSKKASKSSKKSKQATTSKSSRKKKQATNPICGPCDNCGATASPQWRHGTNEKPVVCNACGIRYGRTNSFDKAPAADQKRTASGAAISAGGHRRAKRVKTESQSTSSVDAWQEDAHEGFSQPSSKVPTAIKSQSRTSTPDDIAQTPATSPCDSPASTGTIYDVASTPPSPLRLEPSPLCLDDIPAAATAAAATGGMQASGACSSSPIDAAQQHQVLRRGRRVRRTSSRLGPSPLGRVSATGAPVTGAAALTNPQALQFAPGAPAQHISVPGSSPPMPVPAAAAEAHPAGTVAGVAAPCVPVNQPEGLHWITILGQHALSLGSVEAAISFLNSCEVTVPITNSSMTTTQW